MKYLSAMQRFTGQLPVQQKANQAAAFFQALFIFKDIMMKIQQTFTPDIDARLLTLVVMPCSWDGLRAKLWQVLIGGLSINRPARFSFLVQY